MRLRSAAESIVTTVSIVAALILLNALTFGARAKLDLTEQKIYTLSPASTRLLRGLPTAEKVHVRAYFGNVPREQDDKQRYLEQLLTEYAEASGGRLVWQKIQVSDKPEEQAELKKQGVTPTPIPTVKNDKFELALSYFQVQFQYMDKKEIWVPDQGFFQRSMEGMEYEFTTRLRRLVAPRKKIGVTSGFGEADQTRILEHPQLGLADFYDVVKIEWSQKPEDLATADAIVVNAPTEPVSDKAKWYLDQFLMSGKPVLFLVPGLKWQAGGDGQMPNFVQEDKPIVGMPANHGLGDLLAHYGFEVASDTVIDAKNAGPGVLEIGAPPLVMPRFPFAPLAEAVPRERNGMFEGLELLTFPYPSTVKTVGRLGGGAKPEGGDVQLLFRTSPRSFPRAGVQIISRGMEIKSDDKAMRPDGYPIGYAAWGQFPSFYADKPRPEGVAVPAPAGEPAAAGDAGPQVSEPPPGEPLKASPTTTRLIVIGSGEFVSDKLAVTMRVFGGQPFANGFRAFHNMVDWLLQDTELIAVRGKVVQRPLRPLEDRDRLLVKYGNLIGAPLALVLFGLVYWRVRVRRRRHIRL